MKMPIKDFVAEIKIEIACYEELGQKKADEWEQRFNKWLIDPKSNKKNIIDKKYYKLKDESELFAIADGYLSAVDSGEEEKYWNEWE